MYVLIQTAVGGYTLGETSLTTQTYTSAVTQTASYNLFTAPSADDAHVHWLCVLIANLKQAARISSYELILNSKRSQDLFWSGCKCLTNLELKNYTTKRMYWVSLNNYCFLGFFFLVFFFFFFVNCSIDYYKSLQFRVEYTCSTVWFLQQHVCVT